MALYRSSLAHMDVTEQLIEQSRDAVLEGRFGSKWCEADACTADVRESTLRVTAAALLRWTRVPSRPLRQDENKQDNQSEDHRGRQRTTEIQAAMARRLVEKVSGGRAEWSR
jgi:hypothetical protein